MKKRQKIEQKIAKEAKKKEIVVTKKRIKGTEIREE